MFHFTRLGYQLICRRRLYEGDSRASGFNSSLDAASCNRWRRDSIKVERNDIRRITAGEISQDAVCPANEEILVRTEAEYTC